MIKDYKLTEAFVNLDEGKGCEKICVIGLDIKDKDEVEKAIKICNTENNPFYGDGLSYEDGKDYENQIIHESKEYYKNGWIIEVVVDEDAVNIISGYDLYYIGDNGRVYIMSLDEKEDGKLISDLKEFLFKELEYHK